MSAHDQGSGPRSNRYSKNRLTNWAEYKPWWLEVQAVFKRFDGRIGKLPEFPKIIELEPIEGFLRPCIGIHVEAQLRSLPGESVFGLRAVFILSGTKKQLKSCSRSTFFYGHYWRCCVFMHPYPFSPRIDLDRLHRFYVRNVLVHEVGHHVDLHSTTKKDRERFAEQFAESHG